MCPFEYPAEGKAMFSALVYGYLGGLVLWLDLVQSTFKVIG